MGTDATPDERVLIQETEHNGISVQVSVSSSATSPSISSNIQPTSTPTITQRRESTLLTSQSEELSIPLTLAKYGIKVRDFAYESTLPPIAPVPRVPRQVQPGPRPLKRARRNHDENEDDPLTQRNSGGPSNVEGDPPRKSKPLERQLTEPDIPNSQRPTRAWALPDTGLCESSIENSIRPHTPIQPISRVPFVNSNLSPSSQPPLQYSQESESYVDTPLVTPNGSLQWPVVDNSAVPASQLDNDLQMPTPKLAPYSQRGYAQSPPIDELSQRDTSPIAPDFPTALSSLSEPSHSLLRIPTNIHEMSSQRPAHRHTQPALVSLQPTTSPATPSRYFLRQRPASTAPYTTRPHSRQQHSFTMQSAHSRAKSQKSRNSPRSKTKRKDHANGKEDSMLVG